MVLPIPPSSTHHSHCLPYCYVVLSLVNAFICCWFVHSTLGHAALYVDTRQCPGWRPSPASWASDPLLHHHAHSRSVCEGRAASSIQQYSLLVSYIIQSSPHILLTLTILHILPTLSHLSNTQHSNFMDISFYILDTTMIMHTLQVSSRFPHVQ